MFLVGMRLSRIGTTVIFLSGVLMVLLLCAPYGSVATLPHNLALGSMVIGCVLFLTGQGSIYFSRDGFQLESIAVACIECGKYIGLATLILGLCLVVVYLTEGVWWWPPIFAFWAMVGGLGLALVATIVGFVLLVFVHPNA